MSIQKIRRSGQNNENVIHTFFAQFPRDGNLTSADTVHGKVNTRRQDTN